MEKQENSTPFFIAAEVIAPWPEKMPKSGRLISPDSRHLTLAHLRETSFQSIEKVLAKSPIHHLKISPVGQFTDTLFLPNSKQPRLVAWEVQRLEKKKASRQILQDVRDDLENCGIEIDKKAFHPHVTLAQGDIDVDEWKDHFTKIPLILKKIHLYRSEGNGRYQSLWNLPLELPFQEMPHTADMAFLLRGKTPEEIHLHAQVAIAFAFPQFFPYLDQENSSHHLDDIVIHLNELVSRVDCAMGSPLKAVSFHGEIAKKAINDIYEWEMIIDV